ncbi:MAG: hydroxymethylglutaryl-CoA reductase [Candidatus Diapherotrites archaeon]|nr:hydroxymethylglutaryl-CoA reductase [Candidatus Diapherotrites archaeon]
MKLREMKDAKERREAIEAATGVKLDHVSRFTFDEESAMKKNVENLIGATQLPLGAAGPLLVNGEERLIPLATTEGALVASVNRGCTAINEAGGAKAIVIKDRMTRSALFRVKGIGEAKALVDWVNSHFEEVAAKTGEGSRFLKVKKIKMWIVGRNVYLRFECFTGDAMGMNMVTIGVHNASEWIAEKTGAEYISASANMCVDKKAAAINMIEGRGKTVLAEVVLPDKVVEEVLKTTSDLLVDLAYRKNMLGSAQAGSYGFNMHVANVIAAMYIALGQDAAQSVNGSIGFSLFERVEGGVHVSLKLPALEVGTVGGGTGLATQHEALEMVGLAGSGEPPGSNAVKLAEVICAACLAGEVSGMSAQASHQLARAHKELGR